MGKGPSKLIDQVSSRVDDKVERGPLLEAVLQATPSFLGVEYEGDDRAGMSPEVDGQGPEGVTGSAHGLRGASLLSVVHSRLRPWEQRIVVAEAEDAVCARFNAVGLPEPPLHAWLRDIRATVWEAERRLLPEMEASMGWNAAGKVSAAAVPPSNAPTRGSAALPAPATTAGAGTVVPTSGTAPMDRDDAPLIEAGEEDEDFFNILLGEGGDDGQGAMFSLQRSQLLLLP